MDLILTGDKRKRMYLFLYFCLQQYVEECTHRRRKGLGRLAWDERKKGGGGRQVQIQLDPLPTTINNYHQLSTMQT